MGSPDHVSEYCLVPEISSCWDEFLGEQECEKVLSVLYDISIGLPGLKTPLNQTFGL